MKILKISLVILVFAFAAFAQVRPAETKPAPTPDISKAPKYFTAKYEGGFYGSSEKMKGSLRIDDENERLVFFDEKGKERISLNFEAFLAIYPSEKTVQSTAGKVVSNIPYASVFGGLMKEKQRFLILQFRDPDIDTTGNLNFKMETREDLEMIMAVIAEKAELKQRGDAYYKPAKRVI